MFSHPYGGWIVSKVQSLFWRRVANFTEEGSDFDWRGCFSVGGYHFFVEEECVLISRRGSSSSGVGGHTSLGRGAIIDLEEGVILSLDKG